MMTNRQRVLESELIPEIVAEMEGPIGWLQFNDPERHNAISLEMWAAIPRVLKHFEEQETVRAVILSGVGGKAFISGANIAQFDEHRTRSDVLANYDATTAGALNAIYECSKPTLAKINGYCIGGGVSVAVACDIRIASDTSQFAIPAAKLGLGYRLTAMRDLVTLIGPGNALDIFLSAQRFGAQKAKDIGLVQHVVEAAELDTYTERYVSTVAQNAPMTLRTTKSMVRALRSMHADIDQQAMAALVAECFSSEDYAEGKQAFAEKRRPMFQGK